MHELIDLCREFAPVASVLASLVTVILIPVLRTLNRIDTKLEVMGGAFKSHEKLDDVRFRSYEQRLNELSRQPGEFG